MELQSQAAKTLGSDRTKSGKHDVALFLCFSLLFSVFTVYLQQQYLGLTYLEEGNQIKRHLAVLENTAPNPWQYRVLSDYLVEVFVIVFNSLHVPHPIAAAFLSFRIVQNILIFFLAGLFYKKLGLHTYATLLGFALLAWAMSHSLLNSDLQFSTYFDVVFYLSAGLILLYDRDEWIIPLTLLAALNRETCGLIPFMLLAKHLHIRPRIRISKRAILIFAAACAVYVIVFVGLRYVHGTNRPMSGPIGIDLIRSEFVYSLDAWAQFFATLSILPLLTILSLRYCPRAFRVIFWAVIPGWFIVIPFTGGLFESRHYLVPQALVFIPGALLGIMLWRNLSGERNTNSLHDV